MRKLEIGTHESKKGWETLDILPPADIVADITKTLPIEDNTYDEVYLSHVLEHVKWYRVKKVLKELHRILKPKGVIEIHVPDMGKIIEAYSGRTIPDRWYKFNADRDPFLWFVGRVYTYGEHDSDFHKGAFNEEYLKRILADVGFVNLQLVEERENIHGYINLGVKGMKL